MKRMLIRYKAKPEQVQENERLIETVFQELRATSPDGVRYLVLKLDDGTFAHFVAVETEDGTSPLPQLAAFRSSSSGPATPPSSATIACSVNDEARMCPASLILRRFRSERGNLRVRIMHRAPSPVRVRPHERIRHRRERGPPDFRPAPRGVAAQAAPLLRAHDRLDHRRRRRVQDAHDEGDRGIPGG